MDGHERQQYLDIICNFDDVFVPKDLSPIRLLVLRNMLIFWEILGKIARYKASLTDDVVVKKNIAVSAPCVRGRIQ